MQPNDISDLPTLSDVEHQTYQWQLWVKDFGEDGQRRLKGATVLISRLGGVGGSVAYALAAAGVGTLGIVDPDVVDLSNLQRQVIHDGGTLGLPKVDSAAARIRAINPDVRVEPHHVRLTAANAAELVAGYDLVADGTDNFETRYLINDACFHARRTLVSAAILRFEGQLSVFKPHQGQGHPCYRCLFPDPPAPGQVPTCAQGGVFGALAGAMGSLQAIEVLKEVLGIGESLSGRLLLFDGLRMTFRTIRFPRDPDCRLCGAADATA